MWWVSVALAAPPPALAPMIAPTDAPTQWAAARAAAGKPADPLVCGPLWADAALLCFQVNGRWVTEADLTAWQVSASDLRATVVAAAPARVVLAPKQVEGRTYWTADGPWAGAALLAPGDVAKKLGVDAFYGAAPSQGVTLIWIPGDADLDRMMAVGARKMYDALDGSVSPLVFRWSATGWAVFAEAKPKGATP